MARKIYQPWEIAFIQLAYPLYKYKDIGNYLNINKYTVRDIVRKIGIVKRKKKIKEIKIGEKYNRLEVLEYIGSIKGHKSWLCKCECGNTKVLVGSGLINGKPKSCGCLRKETSKRIRSTGYKGVSGTYIGMIKRHMKERNYKQEIDIKYIANILENQNYLCALTNMPIEVNTNRVKHKDLRNQASLDRIKSSEEYIYGNCQWILKDINTMKWDFDQDYFIYLCHLVAQKNPCPEQYKENLEKIKSTLDTK